MHSSFRNSFYSFLCTIKHVLMIMIIFCNGFRTLKRPIPLEHCIFYSGEFYKICQNEVFLPKGIQDAKDAFKKKNSRIGGGAGPSTSYASSQSRGQIKQHEQFSRGRGHKHHVPQNAYGISGTSGTFQSKRGTWGSQSTSWLLLIKKLTNLSLSPVRGISFLFSSTSNLSKLFTSIFIFMIFISSSISKENLPTNFAFFYVLHVC